MTEDYEDTIREQEATIQLLKSRLPYWADQLEEFRNAMDSDGFEQAIAEMRRTADQL